MIYFDNSATTKVLPEVLKTYNVVSEEIWGNPSSLHKMGEKSYNLLEQSRKQIADLMGWQQDEIYFTSGGTEGDNWIIKGTAIEKRPYGKHIITTSIEHPAVLNSMQQLEKLGFEVTYLPVDRNGRVIVDDLIASLRNDTILVSVMAVNNEVGSIQPLAEIAEILKKYPKVQFHVDAVQGIGKGIQNLLTLDRIDFVTFSGHKFHAPRGVGFVYKKRGKTIAPLLSGGGQEKNLRSSTENLPAIVGMAKALRLLLEHETDGIKKQQNIRTKIVEHLQKFENVEIFSGLDDKFAPHILCFSINGVRGETIVHAFEEYDIFISTTSACSSKKGTVSGTLKSMHIDESIATSAVRVSLDENNTLQEAEEFMRVFDILYKKFEKLN
ncbi:cysteine desulfurase [Ligilactobacillus hayakitensis DSM 18933 = JCM 14209]|uniref:Cysteine desulfurase n=1 Tax=Ligilactobacillus hayakitensis DSM 18933 = JCM 14209 TaxID=1423755 RepID=A0A0R1WN64_9LACO|nr:cysteine desulfurase family protein [Ligilactobacillus hayakitensis]KRM19105.1 cysteine desulfurase [Ligilactobacillus hayakitensis DSM 18933 = JCM 14209]